MEDNQEVITLNLAHLRGKKSEYIAETILHEFVHSITATELDKYYDSVTKTFKPGTPKELHNLMHVYKEYKEKIIKRYPVEYQEFLDRYIKNKENNLPPDTQLTQFERDAFYATVDVKEFVATVLGNSKGFRKEAWNMTYSKTNESITKRFNKFIVDLFSRLGKSKDIDTSILEGALYASLESVEYLNKKKIADLIPRKVPNINNTEGLLHFKDLFDLASEGDANSEESYPEEYYSNMEFKDVVENLPNINKIC